MAVRSFRTSPRLLERLASRRRWLCTKQVAVCVEDERVQELLQRMTGMDFERVFRRKREPLTAPRYKLMSQEQLEEAHMEAVRQAQTLLRMSPVLPERAERGEVIEMDERLEGVLENKMVFTDISPNKNNSTRHIVVREPSGDLREATWEERDRMCQVYFPVLGRKMWLPEMLQEDGLVLGLGRGSHLDILDLVCVQCEPDSGDYIGVHHRVYEDIDLQGWHGILWSTRHFGGMVWYLICNDRISGLLQSMLKEKLYSDAEDLLRLHLLCYPTSGFAQELKQGGKCSESSDLLEVYCRHHKLTELLGHLPSNSQPETSEQAVCPP